MSGGARRLVLGGEDAGRGANRELRTLFFQETLKTGRPVLVEKLPANNFRLPFLRALYPRARFIHILRNGREVAASIERWTGKAWFGAGDYKWKELVRFARSREETLELPGLCDNDYERGLLEWRLSTEAVRGFFENARPGICLEVRYDEFISRPAETVDSVLSFMGLERSREVGEYAAGNIARRARAVGSDGLSEKEEALAGELLRRTDGKISSPEG